MIHSLHFHYMFDVYGNYIINSTIQANLSNILVTKLDSLIQDTTNPLIWTINFNQEFNPNQVTD